jgi:hypothetical protein
MLIVFTGKSTILNKLFQLLFTVIESNNSAAPEKGQTEHRSNGDQDPTEMVRIPHLAGSLRKCVTLHAVIECAVSTSGTNRKASTGKGSPEPTT